MSEAGLVVGISEISQGLGLDVKPYFVGRATSIPSERPGSTYLGDVGGDFFYNITPNLRANFTINTDFAETEVDDRQVNLTRFPLRFPEKREFFLQGANFFEFSGDRDAFFTRRIGLSDGEVQRIDYGLKLTGQLGDFDVGVLQVRTAEFARPEDEDGNLPGEDFTVFRTRRRFLSQSHMGLLTPDGPNGRPEETRARLWVSTSALPRTDFAEARRSTSRLIISGHPTRKEPATAESTARP